MMARSPTLRYACNACGGRSANWTGRCLHCGAWGSVSEEIPIKSSRPSSGQTRSLNLTTLKAPQDHARERMPCGITEVDRVLGGGSVLGATILLGGDPGIGKSTLMLQIIAGMTPFGKCLYLSGEEAEHQVQLRAQRLGLSEATVELGYASTVEEIIATIEQLGTDPPLRCVVIDSIQTMRLDAFDSAAGTVSQVRGSAQALMTLAKERGITLWLIGHVTKDGHLAGPRVLEHMVDVVLMFEGERQHPFRLLRSLKNRFGSTADVGVFDMTESGLMEVTDPSQLFIEQRRGSEPGSVLFCAVEGSRPMIVEVQALVSPANTSIPRRSTVGCDANRLAMLLAVLEARAQLPFGQYDVYLNVVGGLRIMEPAMDLAAILALLSASTSTPLPADAAAFGEVVLTGEARTVGHVDLRLRELNRLGVKQVWLARHPTTPPPAPLCLHEVKTVLDLKAKKLDS